MTRDMANVLRSLSQWYGTSDGPLTLSREEVGELIDAIEKRERQYGSACLAAYRLALQLVAIHASWLPTGSLRQWATLLAAAIFTHQLARVIFP